MSTDLVNLEMKRTDFPPGLYPLPTQHLPYIASTGHLGGHKAHADPLVSRGLVLQGS